MLGNKAQSGVGTLIMFIAALLAAAIAASVFITSGSLFQAKASVVGKATQDDASSAFIISDIYATDGSDGTVNYFKQLVKLPPGMPSIDLDYVLLSFGTYDETARLTYAGEGSDVQLGNTGYNTWLEEEIGEMSRYFQAIAGQIPSAVQTALSVDLDLDGLVDYVVSCRDGDGFCDNIMYDGAYMQFDLSGGDIIYVPILNSAQQPVSIINKGNGDYLGNYMSEIGSYGYVTLHCAENAGGAASWVIPANCMNIFLTPTYLTEDLDDDRQNDAIAVTNTEFHFFASSRGDILDQMNDSTGLIFPLGEDLSLGAQTLDTQISLVEGTTRYGTVDISGATSRAAYIDETVTVQVIPHQLNLGHYSVQYVQRSKTYREGRLSSGDVIWIYFEAPRDIGEDEEIRISLIPRNGQASMKEFFMPNIIVKPSISVYH